MTAARAEWRGRQAALDPARLVFLDETWATTNMARRYGRAPRGQRALDAVPHGRWRTTTVVAALRADGIAAPLVPVILVVAAAVALMGSLLGDPEVWLSRSLVVLVAAAPCAFVISVPVTVVAAVGPAALAASPFPLATAAGGEVFGTVVRVGAAVASAGVLLSLVAGAPLGAAAAGAALAMRAAPGRRDPLRRLRHGL